MNLAAPPPENEKSNTPALVLSALVHLLLIAALFFGVQWKSQAPTSVEVEVWRSAPAPVIKTEPAQEPPPKPEPKPEPEPKPIPKAEPAPTIKPDITLKDKKPKKEPPKEPEQKKEIPKKPPQKEPVPDRRPSFDDELNRDLKQTQQQKANQEHRERAAAEATEEANRRAQLKAGQASAANARGLAAYGDKITAKIRGNIVLPSSIRGNPEAIFIVTQLPTGEILPPIKVQKSSGNKSLDEAIERAILKSSPLPKPDQPELFQRILELKYKPFDE